MQRLNTELTSHPLFFIGALEVLRNRDLQIDIYLLTYLGPPTTPLAISRWRQIPIGAEPRVDDDDDDDDDETSLMPALLQLSIS